MHTRLAVKDRKEAAAIRRALAQPTVRATVVLAGVLGELPSDQARQRVLRFVVETVEEEEAAAAAAPEDGATP